MAARLCPHCDVRSNFSNKSGISGSWRYESQILAINLETWQCQNCQGLIIVVRSEQEDPVIELFTYPSATPSVDKSIPENVQADYTEGVRCLGIGAYKAAATMFRRSLQQVMLEKQAPQGNLVYQINSLAKEGIIPKEMAEWSHEIRLWGNEGAHPPTDGLDKITDTETKQVQEFLERIFEWLYIMPTRLNRSRVFRDARGEQTEEQGTENG